MQFYAELEEKGYRLEAYTPTSTKEDLAFLIKAYKGKELVKEYKIPMLYFPSFGVDVDDHRLLEIKTDEIFNDLINIDEKKK